MRAFAQDAEQASPEQAEASESAEAEVDEAAVADALEGVEETPGKTYMFMGVRYRNVMIPQFVQNLFADGGKGLYAHTPGLEFAIRRDKFEYQLFAMLGLYHLDDVPFKGKSDDNDAWEIIDANYNILFLGADFMWSTDDFSPGLSLTYGAGVGLGVVFGDLGRVQAYPADANGNLNPALAGDPGAYRRCDGVGRPSVAFCQGTGDGADHYGDFVEPTWADGGSSPLIFPWMAANFGLRYKAHKNFVGRVELGLMPTGAFVGIGADYGL
jgi:hypothetical protein